MLLPVHSSVCPPDCGSSASDFLQLYINFISPWRQQTQTYKKARKKKKRVTKRRTARTTYTARIMLKYSLKHPGDGAWVLTE